MIYKDDVSNINISSLGPSHLGLSHFSGLAFTRDMTPMTSTRPLAVSSDGYGNENLSTLVPQYLKHSAQRPENCLFL